MCLCAQLIDKGEVVRGYIGVAMRDLSERDIVELSADETGGVLVTLVQQGRPAEESGIRVGLHAMAGSGRLREHGWPDDPGRQPCRHRPLSPHGN